MPLHEGEESHVLLEGDIVYALGDTLFTIKGPYVVNIPAGVPHAFKISEIRQPILLLYSHQHMEIRCIGFLPF